MKNNVIYTTSNYKDFAFKEGNRQINEKHVKDIAENMKEKGWVGAPIEVSDDGKKLVIEDGQHRFMACKETNTPVHFMVVEPRTIYDVAIQNSMSKKWGVLDYVEAYALDGNTAYKRVLNLINEFTNLTPRFICYAVDRNTKYHNSLQKGYLKLSDERYYLIRNNLITLSNIMPYIKELDITTIDSYQKALYSLINLNLIEEERMIDKIQKYGSTLLYSHHTAKQVVEDLEKLYNYKQQKDIVYFMDAYKRANR